MEQNMVAELRDICNRYSTDDFDVTIFHPFFIYIDQVSVSIEGVLRFCSLIVAEASHVRRVASIHRGQKNASRPERRLHSKTS